MTLPRNDPRLPEILRKVRAMAHSISRRLPSNVSLDDLISAGNLGVATAAARHGGADAGVFQAYALMHARGAIFDELRRLDPMTRTGRMQARKATAAIRNLRGKLGREPEEDEVAKEMGVDTEKYRRLKGRQAATTLSADTCGGSTDRDAVVLVDESLSVEDAIDEHRRERSLKSFLSEQMERLPERHAKTVTLSFEEGQTLGTIAQSLGVSEARVCQIRKAALKMMRKACAVNDIMAPHEVA